MVTDGDKIRQFCDPSSCSPGFRYTSEEGDCNEYYPDDDDDDNPLYKNIQCCVPNFDRCLLLEDEIRRSATGMRPKFYEEKPKRKYRPKRREPDQA